MELDAFYLNFFSYVLLFSKEYFSNNDKYSFTISLYQIELLSIMNDLKEKLSTFIF